MDVVLASSNAGKIKELQDMLADLGVVIIPQQELSIPDIEETGLCFVENAILKARNAALLSGKPAIADDSGLEVDGLKGEPGVHSAHFGKPSARESQDAANRRKILEGLKGKSDRKARMRCVLVFMLEGVVIRAEGICEGRIAEKEQGSGGFGYDSIFIPDAGGGKTFAELSREEKNTMSHRALAMNELVKLMHEREIQLVRP